MSEVIAIVLLKEIASNTASQNSLWIAVVAGSSAVLGAAVSACLAYFAASKAANIQLHSRDTRLPKQSVRAPTELSSYN